MYLKKLLLVGFKSFADKTEFLFEPGVTAIVGPNGCGKSNISDAIKWVLGEQSAKGLRASCMEDVIFNGAGTKPPLGMAEVSLTLSNEAGLLPIDYTEVTLTRRLFRSGESEYLLNNNPVRLKDIQELLRGTGIGTSAYSIMEQGRIDQVLSAKPDDRRMVFEEASGISRFRAQKREACRKLESTDQNILRLVDILTEVQRQLAAVDRQAQRAERYKANWEKLKAFEVGLAKRQDVQLQAEQRALVVRQTVLLKEEEVLRASLDEAEDALRTLRREQEAIESAFREAELRVASINSRRAQWTDQMQWNDERMRDSAGRVASLEQESEALRTGLARHEAGLNELAADRTRLQAERAQHEQELQQRRQDMEKIAACLKDAEGELSQRRDRVFDLKNQQAHARNALTEIRVSSDTMAARIGRLQQEEAGIREEAQSVQQTLQQGASDLEQMKHLLEELEGKRAELTGRLSAAEAEYQQLDERQRGLLQETQTVRTRLETLEDMRRRHEGLSRGARELLTADLSGVCGAIGELFEVREGSERAVERLLGDRRNAVIVDTDDTARRAIQYLKDRNLGSATVVSLERLQRAMAQAQDSNHVPQDVKRLVECVMVEERFRPVVRWLLDDVFVVDGLPEAMDLAERLGMLRRSTVVTTMHGEYADFGSVSGGVFQANDETMVIGRDQRIRTLQTTLATLDASCQQVDAELLAAKERLDAMTAELAHTNDVRQMTQVKQAEFLSRQEEVIGRERKLAATLTTLALEIQELQSQRDTFVLRQSELDGQLASLAQEESAAQAVMAETERLIEEQQQAREALRVAMAQIEATLSALINRDAEFSRTVGVVEQARQSDQGRLDQAARQMVEEQQKQVGLAEARRTLESSLESLTREQTDAEQQRVAVQQQRADHGERLTSQEHAVRTIHQSLDDLRELKHRAEVLRNDLQSRHQQLNERLRLTYNVTLDTAEGEPLSDADVVESGEQIEKLRSKLSSMGPVNMVAIEERQELQERLEFLTAQHNDLLESKADLLEAIAEINKTTRTMFIETFDQISVEFQRYFHMLFGGGEARLILQDRNDVLETGIDIFVSPPGKRLQQLSLLSGGERTMTAVALLFAIFCVKPSPFCVLDEIDAALDEANVGRFANVLDDFVQGSQFIIVTHNKKTIQRADVLYGITMAERGVSRVVSAKMVKDKEEREAVTNDEEIAEPLSV